MKLSKTERQILIVCDHYVTRLQECVDSTDTERAHINADKILCEFLTQLGWGEIVKKYEEIDKWYV